LRRGTCEECGEQFESKRNGKNRFCSRICTARNSSKQTAEPRECDVCKTVFIPRAAGRENRFCSAKCRNREAYLRNGIPEIRGDRKEYYQNVRFKKYGLSPDDIRNMMDEQGGKCKICECDITKEYHIDHCHDVGKVRGLLCNKHNRGLGYFNHDPLLLMAAAEYLLEHQDA
jgi:hypothetical protein